MGHQEAIQKDQQTLLRTPGSRRRDRQHRTRKEPKIASWLTAADRGQGSAFRENLSASYSTHASKTEQSPDAVCAKGMLNDGNVPVRGVSLQGPPAAGDRGTTPVDRCAGRRMGPGSRWGALEQDLWQSEAAELKGGAAIPGCGVRAGRERPRGGPARNAVRMRSHTPCSCGVPRATSAGPLCRASTGRSPQPQVVCGS